MSRTQDHHVISLHVGAIHAQSDGGFCRSIKWIDRHGEESEITLFAEAGPECLRLHTDAEARLDAYANQARSCLPETQGEVDLASEANPPRFQAGDRVTPVQSKMYIGIIATVEDASPDGDYLRFTEGNRRWFPASLFRLADPGPLAEANPPMELPF